MGLILLIFSALAGCEMIPFDLPWVADEMPTPTPQPGEIDQLTPTPEMPPVDEVTPAPVTQLLMWVPPEMDPELDSEAARLFADQLASFSELNNDVEIQVRVKAASGAGGLLDSLTATSAAAPVILPDLVLLSRPDLESAALKGIIFSLDGLTEVPDDNDWYDFAREMALLQGSTFGLPFAADSLVLVYRPEAISPTPNNWAMLVDEGLELIFPAESDQALFALTLYLAEGGAIQDSQRRPILQAEPLEAVFELFQDGVDSGTFPIRINQYQTSSQVWEAFLDGEEDLVVAWLSDYLKTEPADSSFTALFPMSEGSVSLGTGMSWAVPTMDENQRTMAVQLAEFLTQADFISEWSSAAGYIPPRPSALEGWENLGLRFTINQVALMTQLRPSNDTIASLGPVLREGTRQVLQNQLSPAEAALSAVDSLED